MLVASLAGLFSNVCLQATYLLRIVIVFHLSFHIISRTE